MINLPFFHYLTQKVREASQDEISLILSTEDIEISLILSTEDISHLTSNGVPLTAFVGNDGVTRYKVSSSLLKEIFLL